MRNYEEYEDGFSIHRQTDNASISKQAIKGKNLPWQLKAGKIKKKYLKSDEW